MVLTAHISQKPRDKLLCKINKIQEIINQIYGYFPKFKLRFVTYRALNLKKMLITLMLYIFLIGFM